MPDENRSNFWALCGVYGKWFFLNFFLCLLPIAVSYYFRDAKIPSSVHKEIISSYFAYLATLLAVTLYLKRRPTSLGPLIQIGSIIFAFAIFIAYMLYNLVLSVHNLINQHVYVVLAVTYVATILIALYFSWDALIDELQDHLRVLKLREADEAGKGVRDMKGRV